MQNNRESVFTFFVLVFLLSIPFWVLGAINSRQLLPGLPISALGAFTPAFVTPILAYKYKGTSGVSEVVQLSFDFKRINNKKWYLAIIFINPFIAVVAYWLIRATGKSLPNPTPLTFAVFPMFVAFIVAALGEEIGWSGYATEPLLRCWGTITTGVLIGLVGTVWHFIPLMQAHRSFEWIAWWALGSLALRMIMTWLYTHTGKSIFGAAVFHTMINLSWQLFPNNGSHYDPRIFGLITLGFAITMYATERFLPSGKLSTA